MVSKDTTVSIGIGFAPVPFGFAKASASEAPSLKSLCDCGSKVGAVADDDGNKVACKNDECGNRWSWYTGGDSPPQKGYPLGDEMVPVNPAEIPDEPPVDTGQVEKVSDVGNVLLEYAVTGNYYLLPEDEYEEQYGALVGVLNDENLALLTYLQPHSKTRRYAVVSRAGVLIALELADKKAIPTLAYETSEAMEGQAKSLLAGQVTDDPSLPDVEGENIKQHIRESVKPQAFAPEDDEGETDEAEPFAEV